MPRDGTRARARLRSAALELYLERGYADTTAAQIAARAGVTERTYFRHFADKREVLFDGEAELRAILVDAIATAPTGLTPLQILGRAFAAAVPLLVANRPIAAQREQVIASTPALRERALAKADAVTDAIAEALVRRGQPPPAARLAAQVGMAAFDHAYRAWSEDPQLDLDAMIAQAGEAVLALGDRPVR